MLIAKRRLLIKLREVPVAEFDDYRNFLKNLQNDVNRYVQTSSSSASLIPNAPLVPVMPIARIPGSSPSLLSEAMKLPASNSPDANQFEADAYSAIRRGEHFAAVSAFKSAVEADPKFTRARLELAAGYMASGLSDAALDTLRKAIESDPKQALVRKAYVAALAGLGRTTRP